MNLGEILGVAVNSVGTIMVLNHPGSATTGPLYDGASTQLLEFDRTGNFVREIGQGVYGLGYAHAIRYDRYDNLWVVDKGTNAVVKFDPAGYTVTLFGAVSGTTTVTTNGVYLYSAEVPGGSGTIMAITIDPDGNASNVAVVVVW